MLTYKLQTLNLIPILKFAPKLNLTPKSKHNP